MVNQKSWHTFIDSFECAIDKNDDLSNVQKMNYLKNLVVEGEAAATSGEEKERLLQHQD